jgi:hypothetical protein
MAQINERIKFDRAVQRTMKKKARKRTLIWLAVIFILSVLLSIIIHFVPIWFDMYVQYNDPSYRPMDIERQYRLLDSERQDGIKYN